MNEQNSAESEFSILIIDDEIHATQSMNILLRSNGYENIICCNDASGAEEIIAGEKIELVLLDLVMPQRSGEEILGSITSSNPEIPVIMVTGTNEVEPAVKCLQKGAADYVLKPIDKNRLLSSVRKALEMARLRRENMRLSQSILSGKLARPEIFSRIITQSPEMNKIFQYCEAVSPSAHPILITGETGTGKELIAGTLHSLSGFPGEFTAVNVAGLDDAVFSDTLFGHSKGAFTGADSARKGLVEKASGGTLFLDEIGDLSHSSQVKLLRLLEQGEYYPVGSDTACRSKARFIFATHKPIDKLKESDQFRKDLYYRLQTHHIHIPPLKQRREDIPALFDYFLEKAAEEAGKNKPAYHKELLTLLSTWHFPGNVRELKGMVYDAVLIHNGKMLSSSIFNERINGGMKNIDPPDLSDSGTTPRWLQQLDILPTIKESANLLIEEAMRRSNSNQNVAAKMLGISPQALSQRLKKPN